MEWTSGFQYELLTFKSFILFLQLKIEGLGGLAPKGPTRAPNIQNIQQRQTNPFEYFYSTILNIILTKGV